ncbi:restriction endonuclease subunit S [Salinicola sp. V024]|uniref:restriction endonuclease subunit S n=1 Tax=Salinicola sp. V024 TaxID=3459609 RepID=UPI0040441DB6
MSAQHLITDHLDLWTGAVTHKRSAGRGSGKSGKVELTGIKKLRELILELAVRGKLVEQDPTDEPASVLLEKIADEKARLVNERKIKKSKEAWEVARDKLTELPETWRWVALGELVSVMDAGWSPACPPEPARESEWGVLKTTSVQIMSYFQQENKRLPEGKEPKCQYEVKSGDILITRAGPKNRVGISCWVDKTRSRLMISDKIIRFHLIDAAMSGPFICLCLNAGLTRQYLERAKSGMAESQMNISQDKLKAVPIPLCPENEQHRIVEKVDALMALCDRLEQQTGDQLEAHEVLVDTLLDALTRSADAAEVAENWARIAEHFDTLFTTEASIDKLKQAILHLAVNGQLIKFKTETLTLKNILSFGPKNGLSPKEINYDTGTKVLKLGATSRGKLDIDESKNIDININSSSHLWIEKGDILIQRGNSSSYVGCNIVVESDQPGIIYPDLMMKIRTNGLANPKFISYSLSSMDSRRFMWRHMTGTSGTMPKISKKTVEEIPIKLPSLNIQMEIVEILENLFSFCETLKASIQKANNINTKVAESLMGRAKK